MRFGIDAKNWRLIERHLVEPLAPHVTGLWVFGSRARGDHKPFSDLDIAFEARSRLPKSLLSQIKENLEDSRLPIKVDLIELKDLAKAYRPGFEKDKISLL